MTKQAPRCTYTAEAGWLTPEERPCGKSHCELNGRCPNHVERGAGVYTCPSCIGKARRTVRDIVTRYAELPAEYEFVGVESEVLNLHGPAAYPGQWAERRARLIRVYAERGWCDFPKHGALAPDDEHHPYSVLGRWDMFVRERWGPPSDLLITVSRAADYLSGEVLGTFAHTQEFEDFTKDVGACLSHLEDVLALSERPEQGAPCPTCRLELDGRRAACEEPECDRCREKAPRLVKRLAEHPPGWLDKGEVCEVVGCKTCAGDFDTWHCPDDAAHHWDHVSYRQRVDGDFIEHALALTADQAAERFGIKASVIRVWGSRELVKKLGKNAEGITLYAVEDIASRVEVSA